MSTRKVLVAIDDRTADLPVPAEYTQTPKGQPRRTSKGALTNQIEASLRDVKFIDYPPSEGRK